MADNLKSKVVKGAAWQMCERIFVQVASFVVTLVLSRVLTPSDYGTIALLTIFLSVSGTLVDCGLGAALVQKKDVTELHFNSMFYTSIAIALTLYGILFLAAPYVADFYAVPSLKWILRVIALTLVFGAINSVQGAALSRGLLFNLSFKISLVTTTTSAIVGITAALCGLGPWALVLQGVISGFVGVIARWFIIAWRPKLMFSFAALKELFSFGLSATMANVFANLTGNIYGLIIGKRYSRNDLAFVNKGESLPNLLMSSITGTIIGVSFPALSRMQDAPDRVREGMSKILQCSTFIVFPMMVGLSVCARDVVLLLFGPQWLPAVIYMQIVCFKVALTPACDVNGEGILVVGRSDLFLKMQLIKSTTFFIVLVASLYFGVFYFVLMQVCFCKLMEYVVNSWPNRKMFKWPIERQLKEMLPAAMACAVMALAVMAVRWLLIHSGISSDTISHLLVRVLIQCGVGVVVYVMVSSMLHVPAFAEYARIVVPTLKRRCSPLGNVVAKLSHL